MHGRKTNFGEIHTEISGDIVKAVLFFLIYDFTLKIFNAWGEHLYNAFMIFWDYCSWVSYPLENSL